MPLLVVATAATPGVAQSAKPAVIATVTATSPAGTDAAAIVTVARTSKEAEHYRRFDASIVGVTAHDITAEQAALVKSAIKAYTDKDPAKGNDHRNQLRDPIAGKLVDWFRLRAGYGRQAEYEQFLADNPAWPDRAILRQRFEELLFAEGGAVATIRSKFKSAEPRTAMGQAALASADLADGDRAAAAKRAVAVWRDMTIPAGYEIPFLERFGSMLNEADHQWRLDRLLVDDVRWAADRNERLPAIRRQIYRLADKSAQKRAEARLLVYQKGDVEAARREMQKALATAPKADHGFTYHRIQLLRRQDRHEDAVKLLEQAPTDPALVANLDDWWAERRGLAYWALNKGNAKLAYALIAKPGPLSVNPAKEQAFMAGWIAMRFLSDPATAKTHFEAAAKHADGPLSRGKAGYWLGRLAEADADVSGAAAHYRAAAKENDTFYGQLAQLRLDPKNRRIEIELPAAPTPTQAKRFDELDALKAIVVARKAGLDAAIPRAFFSHLRSYFESETEIAMVNHLAMSLGEIQTAVRNGKAGVARGQDMLLYAYPVHTFPSFRPLGKIPETAMLLAIARQESEFNKSTVSGAGAKGLLQVMTITAQHVCRDYKIKCEIDRLLPDAAYNAQIAASYIGDRMAEFRGSYVLGIAGYNAGPGRAREWVKAFGDPRDPRVDPLDWIERIPFQETREYVGKVLSNIQVYRARLGDEGNALQLDIDLNRGRGASMPPTVPLRRPPEASDDRKPKAG